MKHFIIALFAVLFSFSAVSAEKTRVEFRMQDNKDGGALVALKEYTPEGVWGVVFVCMKEEDTARVVYITPTETVDGQETGHKVSAIRIVKYKNNKESSIIPFDTIGEGMWNLGVAAGVLTSTEYASKYALRFYDYRGMFLYETRQISDTELLRLAGREGKGIKGCRTSEVDPVSKWEPYGDFPFSTYNKYKK